MVKVLEKAGCTVSYNTNQTCCGQPAFNAGFWGEAKDVCKKFLKDFLSKYGDVYLFGGAGNIFNVFDLFDKVYFLKVNRQLLEERLHRSSSRNQMMDTNNNSLVIWGDWLEEQATKQGIHFIDGSLTPAHIFDIIRR